MGPRDSDLSTVAPPGAGGLYPIRTVSQMTGVHPVTLRAWERRYRLITPTRTPKGHRLYTDADIARIRAVVELLREGIPVGQVKRLVEGRAQGRPSSPDAGEEIPGSWSRYEQRMLGAVNDFDEASLDAVYNDALSLYPLELVSARLTGPILWRLGETWRRSEAGIAREHFFSSFLRNRLGARFNHLNARANGARVLAACPEGEHHELGLLQFCLAAANQGYRVVMLGGDVPMKQVGAAAHHAHCAAIVLSISANSRRGVLLRRLSSLVADTPLPVLVGGEAARRWNREIAATGSVPVGIDNQRALAILARTLESA